MLYWTTKCTWLRRKCNAFAAHGIGLCVGFMATFGVWVITTVITQQFPLGSIMTSGLSRLRVFFAWGPASLCQRSGRRRGAAVSDPRFGPEPWQRPSELLSEPIEDGGMEVDQMAWHNYTTCNWGRIPGVRCFRWHMHWLGVAKVLRTPACSHVVIFVFPWCCESCYCQLKFVQLI